MKLSYLGIGLLLLAACGQDISGPKNEAATAELKGRVSQFGLYRLVRSGGLVNNANTSTGKTVSNPVIQQVRQTNRIPLIKGAHMSLQYRLWYFPDQPAYVDLRRVLKHPEMTLPDGSVSTGSDYMIKGKISVNQVIAYTGYGLDEDYELLEGEWVFEIWYEDKKLVEQKFTTYLPDEEELAALTSVIAPVPAAPTAKKPFSRRDWPKVVAQDKDAT